MMWFMIWVAGMAVSSSRRRGAMARAVGIEIDPLRYLWCQFLVAIMGQRQRVQIVFGNFFHKDLSAATVMVCYLMPDALTKLEDKFRQELRAETRIISNRFTFPNFELIQEEGEARLYQIPPDLELHQAIVKQLHPGNE